MSVPRIIAIAFFGSLLVLAMAAMIVGKWG